LDFLWAERMAGPTRNPERRLPYLHDIEFAVRRPLVPADAKTRIGLDSFEAPILFNTERRSDTKSIHLPHAIEAPAMLHSGRAITVQFDAGRSGEWLSTLQRPKSIVIVSQKDPDFTLRAGVRCVEHFHNFLGCARRLHRPRGTVPFLE
jgi:hypothetical protein